MLSSIDLTQVTIGELLQSFLIVIAFIIVVATAIKKVYSIFMAAHKAKSDDEDFKSTVAKHTEEIQLLNQKMDKLICMNNGLYSVSTMQTRHFIVSTCNTALDHGEIDQYQLQALEDLYTMYKDTLNGNSYVSTLMSKVRELKIKVMD